NWHCGSLAMPAKFYPSWNEAHAELNELTIVVINRVAHEINEIVRAARSHKLQITHAGSGK
ncbi:MAG: hypothetical protein ACRELE_12480, partial [Gemmatimonadales bacterium]